MRIELAKVLVDDQDRALAFYTDILGFEKKVDIPMGGPRWLTVVSPEEPTDMGAVKIAIFDDTCGNLIQIHQQQ